MDIRYWDLCRKGSMGALHRASLPMVRRASPRRCRAANARAAERLVDETGASLPVPAGAGRATHRAARRACIIDTNSSKR